MSFDGATLFFTYGFPPSRGGVQMYTYQLAKAFFQAGKEVIVLAPRAEGDLEEDRRMPFPVVRYPRQIILREAQLLGALPHFLHEHNVSRIFCAVWLPCAALACVVQKITHIPYCVAAHGSELLATTNLKDRFKHALRQQARGWLRPVFERAEAVFAVSSYTRRLLLERGVPDEKVSVVPNGVDLETFHPLPDRDGLRRHLGLEGKKVMLTVARLTDYKGQDKVIAALPRVLEQVPEAYYAIVGEGSEKDHLQHLARKLGVSDRVLFLGDVPTSDLLKWYTASDSFVMLSQETPEYVEGFGLVFLEANACGLPVVAGNSGGVREAVEDGVNGLLVPPAGGAPLIQALTRLLRDGSLASGLADRGRERTRSRFTWHRAARQVLEVLDAHT